jgi:hypothetical protein
VTACRVCFVRDGELPHESEIGWLCCWNARRRLEAALRAIPVLVDELAGLGYVERDTRPKLDQNGSPMLVVGEEGRLVGVPADPVAHLLTAGPLNGSRGAPRVSGSTDRPVPIRIDPTDLLAPARRGSLAVADAAAFDAEGRPTGRWPQDQIGHLAVATELEFWARDWADTRRESCPLPTVRVLAGWLADRLDWACAEHLALDEFAGALARLRTALEAAAGILPARPERVDRPCPACGWWALSKAPGEEYIRCGHCDRALTDDEYRDHLEDVIKTNWMRFDPEDVTSRPVPTTPVWVRDDDLGHVTIGYLVDGAWRSWFGPELVAVSYWAEIAKPADPGPAKDEVAGSQS